MSPIELPSFSDHRLLSDNPPKEYEDSPGSKSQDNAPDATSREKRRKKRNMLQGRKNSRKRIKIEKESSQDGPPARPKARQKYIATSQPIYTMASTSSRPITATAYTAQNLPSAKPKIYRLEELLSDGKGLRVIEWDGRWVKRQK
jgi:hypothetical protein